MRSRSLSLGHYGRLPSYSVDGTGVGYLASTRVVSSSLASESVREEVGEGEDGEPSLGAAPSSSLASSPASGTLMHELGLSLELPTSRLRTSTTADTPPPGLTPDGREEENSGEGEEEGQQQGGGVRASADGGGPLGRTDSDPLGMGYAEGEGEEERPSRARSSRPNPWAPLPGPCLAAVQPVHVHRMQEAQRTLTTMDSMRLRQGESPVGSPFKVGCAGGAGAGAGAGSPTA